MRNEYIIKDKRGAVIKRMTEKEEGEDEERNVRQEEREEKWWTGWEVGYYRYLNKYIYNIHVCECV